MSFFLHWLKNRKKDDWKDKREQDVSVSTPISDTAMKVEAILKGDDSQ